MGRLDNRIALVTGSARGLGEGIARALSREGAVVVCADVLDAGPVAVSLGPSPDGRQGKSVELDVTDGSDLHAGHADGFENPWPRAKQRATFRKWAASASMLSGVEAGHAASRAASATAPMRSRALRVPRSRGGAVALGACGGVRGGSLPAAGAGSGGLTRAGREAARR